MKPALTTVTLMTLYVFLSSSNVNSCRLTENHWKFICDSSDSRLTELLRCYFDGVSVETHEAYEKLQICTGRNLLKIMRTWCKLTPDRETEEEQTLYRCAYSDRTFHKTDENKQCTMTACVVKMPSFQNMMKGESRMNEASNENQLELRERSLKEGPLADFVLF